MDESMFHLTPIWSDELMYWHETYSLFLKGVEHGYYTFNELTPNILSFGTHGFGTVSIYALFAMFFGWNYYSIVTINTLLISIAFLSVSFWVNASFKKTFLLVLLYLTFTPIILYSTTSMSELLNYSTVIVYFSMLSYYFKRKGIDQWLLIILLIVCSILSFVRIINIVLFLPIILIRLNGILFNNKAKIYLLIWIVFSFMLYLLTSQFTSPYPYSFLSKLFNTTGFFEFTTAFIQHLIINILKFIYPFSADAIQVSQRYFFLFICGLSLYRSRIIQSRFRQIELSYSIIFVLLFGFLTINLVTYDVNSWRDYRVLSPVLFGSILFLLMQNKFSFGIYSISANLLFLLLIVTTPEVKTLFFSKDRYTAVADMPLMELVNYSERAESKFTNTLVVNSFEKEIFLNTPPGIGITYTKEISDNLQSEYIIADRYFDLSTYEMTGRHHSFFLYRKKHHHKNDSIDAVPAPSFQVK